MGWIAVVQRARGVSKTVGRAGSAVLAAALVAVALARVVPGRSGYWLDLGLIMFALYLVGCAIGSWLRDWVVSRSSRRRERAGSASSPRAAAWETPVKFAPDAARRIAAECSKSVHPLS